MAHSKTLRQLIDELPQGQLDLRCTSLKFTLKTETGATLKSDYSEQRVRKAVGPEA